MREILVENIVRSHPGVHQVVALRDDGGGIAVFVVPEDSYFDNQSGRQAADHLTLNRWRKVYDLSQLTKEAAGAQVGFNTAGWDSSYTRRPIPDPDIREWVEATVASILELNPRRIYEIGCGTGLLLTKIAPGLERYLGADFSSGVLARLQAQLLALPALGEQVELSHRQADDFSGLGADSFDTVVLNSVAQYFPSLAYMTNVLEHAVELVKPGGHIYIGDVRSLPLLPAFATSVELFQAADSMPAADLTARIRNRLEKDKELVISPAYFLYQQSRLAKISRVEIRLQRGRSDNEMTRYRFSAVLHIAHEQKSVSHVEFHDWEPVRWSIDNMRKAVEQGLNQIVGIRGIKNARVEQDLAVMEMLNEDSTSNTAGTIRRQLATRQTEGNFPEDIFDLEVIRPDIEVKLSWAAAGTDGSFDAVFIPRHLQDASNAIAVDWPRPAAQTFMRLSNTSSLEKIRRDFINRVESYTKENLPANMSLARIDLVDSLARDSRGEIDEAALLAFRA